MFGFAPDLADNVHEVPEDGDFTLLDDVQVGEFEPLVGFDGVGQLLFGPVEHGQVIVFLHFDRLYGFAYEPII